MYDTYINDMLQGISWGFVTGVVLYIFVWGLTIGFRLFKQIN